MVLLFDHFLYPYIHKSLLLLRSHDVIFEELSKQKGPTQNHKILARLPISVIWTTNYDDLIEKAFGNVQKIVDVKSRNEHLSNTLANRECILYKMHGDKIQKKSVSSFCIIIICI
mgnify:CR=1 FL=1